MVSIKAWSQSQIKQQSANKILNSCCSLSKDHRFCALNEWAHVVNAYLLIKHKGGQTKVLQTTWILVFSNFRMLDLAALKPLV